MEIAIRRLSDYSGMKYCGHLSVRDVDGISDFENQFAVESAIAFANSLIEKINKGDSFSIEYLIEDSCVKLRKTMEDDIGYVLMTERDVENEPFVGQWEEATHKDSLNNNDIRHLIIEDFRGSKIGYVILAGFTNKNKAIELRRIAISMKGKGYGKAAIELVKKYVLLNLGFHRIWLDVYDDEYNQLTNEIGKLRESKSDYYNVERQCRQDMDKVKRLRICWKGSKD